VAPGTSLITDRRDRRQAHGPAAARPGISPWPPERPGRPGRAARHRRADRHRRRTRRVGHIDPLVAHALRELGERILKLLPIFFRDVAEGVIAELLAGLHGLLELLPIDVRRLAALAATTRAASPGRSIPFSRKQFWSRTRAASCSFDELDVPGEEFEPSEALLSDSPQAATARPHARMTRSAPARSRERN
jgi:hypothetical protein